jgi:hypothetical protein
MPQIFVYTDADLPEYYQCQVLSFLRIVFPEGFMGENRLRDWITAPRFHPLHFLLVEADLVISHAEVVWKTLEHAGHSYKTYGLTGVFTYPSFQHQGYGLRLIQAATQYILSSDADVAMFHCKPDLEQFYSRADWIPMKNSVTWIGSQREPVKSQELLLMRFISPQGRAARPDFENLPIFFNEDDTW